MTILRNTLPAMANRQTIMFVIVAVLLAAMPVAAHEGEAIAHYLGNEGVMVVHGENKILFDPLFRNTYGQYRSVPREMERAMFEAEPPFDGIDAIFVSHYHGDHFSPALMLSLLRTRTGLRLFAPEQAVEALRQVADEDDEPVFERITAIDLEYQDEPISIEAPNMLVEAVRIPHSGWPTGRRDVQNIAFRITLDGDTTVLHMGDADTLPDHFTQDADYWERRQTDLAFPPYWFLLSQKGIRVLREQIRADEAVGVHVPVNIPFEPSRRAPEYRTLNLFTRPGETRSIAHDNPVE
jgi:L-ascorbate metabolism protein UlaG (beta-lactamase superfamily)